MINILNLNDFDYLSEEKKICLKKSSRKGTYLLIKSSTCPYCILFEKKYAEIAEKNKHKYNFAEIEINYKNNRKIMQFIENYYNKKVKFVPTLFYFDKCLKEGPYDRLEFEKLF